jgi:serine/threonine protein kinase
MPRRALGVSLYAMLTGAPPFVGDTLLATCVPRALQHACMAHAESYPNPCRYELISAAPLELPAALEGTPGAQQCAGAAHMQWCPSADACFPKRTAGDLLRRMLDKDPATRATLEEVRAHPWVTQHSVPSAAAAPDDAHGTPA